MELRTAVARSFVWLKKRCKSLPSLPRGLPSNRWKTLLHLAQIGLAVSAIVIYSLSDILYSFLTHIFISQYRYPFAVPLTFAQVLLTLLFLGSLRSLGFIPHLSYSVRLGEQLLVPSVCESVRVVLVLWAKANATVGLYHITMRFLPLACMAWSWVLGLTAPPSPRIAFLLGTITLTSVSITVSRGAPWVEPLLCVYAPLSLFLHSLSLCWMAKVREGEAARKGRPVSPVNLYFSLMVNKSLVLGFLCLVHPDSARALSGGSWRALLFLAYLLGVLLLGALQHLLVTLAALCGFPLAAALLHTTTGLLEPLMALL